MTDHAGKVLDHNAWITDWPLTAPNVAALVASGRARGKIENEPNNTLQTKGYPLEHNFGHGQQHRSSLLAAMHLLAFLLHTVLGLGDEHSRLERAALPSRETFFQDRRALTRDLHFPSWAGLLHFMRRGHQTHRQGSLSSPRSALLRTPPRKRALRMCNSASLIVPLRPSSRRSLK